MSRVELAFRILAKCAPALKDAEFLLASLEPASHGLTILPFISGERSPGWHAEARMTISSISLHTTPADLLRAGSDRAPVLREPTQPNPEHGAIYRKAAERQRKLYRAVLGD